MNRLDKAVERFSSRCPIDVEWKPFQIDPGTAADGEEFEAYNRRRWGSSGWTNHLRREGKKDGANFANWKWWPNTLKSHQLVQYGLEKHQIPTNQMNRILFESVYEEGENISLTDTLIRIAQAHFSNWNWDELRNYLEENEGAIQVQQDIARGRRQYGISGVPFFVIGAYQDGNKKGTPYGVSGAQSPSALLNIFEELVGEDDE